MAIPIHVQTAISDLSSFLNRALTHAPSRQRVKTAMKNLETIKKHMETGEAAKNLAAPPDESKPSSIEEFFEAVGSGARKAQEALDLESLEYMKNRQSFAPETMYRIPKVSANLKVGMTVSEDKQINFLVIKSGSETSRTLEQEISFDIVSAPPPPDSLEGFAELPINPIMITSQIERDQIWQRLAQEKRNLAGLGDKEKAVVTDMSKKNASRRTLAFRGENSWTLMLVLPPAERSSPQSKTPSQNASVLVLPFERKDGPPKCLIANQRMNHFYSLLFPYGDRQNQLLTELDRI